ncbi:unnamed protein product, partial [Ascophyllum nodosum]
GPNCIFRHNELACLTIEVCMRWASGYVCDGRCDLRHPSVAELEAMEADEFYYEMQYEDGPRHHQRNATVAEGARPCEATTSAPMCKFFAKGRCTKGASCIFSHETPHQEQPVDVKAKAVQVVEKHRTMPRRTRTMPRPRRTMLRRTRTMPRR